jgi:CRP/FNR family transcriptional regulator, cyclic AMP receptor protein
VIQPFLHTVPLFRELSDDELTQVLMVGLVKRHAQGSVILAEGAAGGQLQIIHTGKVRISKLVPGVGEEALTILGRGDFFGEVEFFDGFPASAHVIAHTDCELLAFPHADVKNLMASRPDVSAKFLWAFARTLAGRLRDSNQRLGSLLAISR